MADTGMGVTEPERGGHDDAGAREAAAAPRAASASRTGSWKANTTAGDLVLVSTTPPGSALK
jgi:hypothetical protein